MKFIPLKLKGTYEIRPQLFEDSRGHFAATYLRDEFQANGIDADWIQENRSFSIHENTIRGLHFQQPPAAQVKLISVIHGSILDVVVDIRKDSETYGEWDSIEISSESCNSVFIPAGFAHGFCTLSAAVSVLYRVDNYYSPENERGVIWNDPDLAIEWPTDKPHLSEKDEALGSFGDFESPF